MPQKRKFFSEFFKKNSSVGSITPSSRFLANRMLRQIDFSRDIIIAELGPGTGVFTKKIIEKLNPDSKLYVFELNKEFVEILQKNHPDPRVKFICDSASNIKKYLQQDGVTQVDYIVSSLPLSLIPDNIRTEIIEESFNILKPGGIMTQFQYSQHCKKLFEHYFSTVSTEFTFLNIPPAFIYVCEK